eukprot:g4435.t1
MADTLAGWTASMGARLLHTTSDASDHGESLTSHTSEHDSSHEEHDDVTDQGVGAVVFALALGVITRAYIMNFIKLPYTVQILVFGIVVGLILEFTDSFRTLGSDLSISLEDVANMNPEIIFYALLPILIFESAFFTDVHIFLTQLWQVLALAGPGVMIATILMACFSHYVFPYGWDWNTCLFFGAMTSATDPVAVVALMKELGVSERLAVLIEGESLLNDGTSIVVFSVFFNAASGIGSTSAGFVFQQFVRLGLGGPVVGFLTGMVGSFAIGYILEDHLSEITLTVVVCFSSFLLAEATPIKVSGILSVVIAGLYMSLYGRPRISPSVQEPLREFWSLWGYMANTVIFFLTGLDAATKAFGKDSIIDASDWGYLVLLWVACHIVRGFVICLAYPVLKHGYGTDWQTMVVLSYAGLRGAVGLTLALIVQETSDDNDNIAEEVGDKIMFMIAGLAIMTLLINGTTCGMLLSYFGMDRATKAQTEIFIRACSAVESKLEHVVEELKKDRFLGDAEWPIVWRYVPVLTSRVYWHRIRYGSVVLANGEDEEITSGGTGTGVLSRIPGKGGGARAGGRFAHLPPRLRATWQSYHRKFHVTDLVEKEGGVDRVVDDNLVTDYGNENYHALDNNTVHMPITGVVPAAGGQQGGGAAKGKKAGFRGLVSQMSGLGKSSSSLAGNGNSNGDIAGGYQHHKQLGANHPRRGNGGSGLDSSGRGGMGPRSTGRVMLDDGDGTKSIMVPSLARGASHGALSSLDDHQAIVRPAFGGSQHGGSGAAPHGRLLGHGSNAGRRSSTGTGTGPSFLRGGNVPLGHGSMHRGLAAAAAAARRDGGKAMNAEDARVAKEIEATKSGLSLAREQLKRVDEKLKAAVREAELAADGQAAREAEAAAAAGAVPPSLVAAGVVTPVSNQHHRHESQAAAAAAAALHRASMASGLGVSHGGGKPLQQQPQGGGGARGRRGMSNASKISSASKISRSAKEHQEQLAEARLRFVGAVKANYQDNFRKGWLSDSGLRVLMGNADVQLDDGHLPLEEWSRLRESFTIPDYQLNLASALRYLPIIGQIVGGWIFKKLAFVFELASNFIAAHEDIDILELLPEGDAANQLARENLKQLDNASGTLGQQLPAFPEVARSLKTQVAARFLLAKHREFVHEMFLDGLMNEKEAETTLHVNTEFKIKLDDHPYAEHLPPRAVMLAKVPFLKSLGDEQLTRIVEDDSFCQEELHGSNVVLLRQSERAKHSGHNKGTAGWYYIVRGSVQMVTVSQEQEAGPVATATGERKGGHFMGGDGHTTASGGLEGEGGSSLKIREHPLHAGAVFGMTDSMLGLPFRATYTTTSFVHLFFFDRNSFLFEALKSEDLNRSLWRTVGVSVLRKFYGFHCLRLQELQKMVQNAEFVDVMQEGVGVTTTQIEYKVEALRAKAASRVGKTSQSHSNSLSDLNHGGDGYHADPPNIFPFGTHDDEQDDGRIHIHQLKDNERGGIAKTLSNMGLYNMDTVSDEHLAEAATMLTPHSSSSQTLKVVDVEPKRLVLLVKGQLLPRPPTNSHPGVEMHTAPCLLTDVSGRLVFTKDTKMFLIPLSVVEKSKKYTSARRTRLEKTAHRQDTIQDLNEHRLPGAKHVGHDEMIHIKQDALGVGGRTDLAARQALTRKHSEMAKRASETGFFDEDGAPLSQHTPEHPVEGGGASADGNYAAGDGGGGEGGVAPRKSFVMKRSWGGMKMVEVDEDGLPVSKPQLGCIMEERERQSSTVSNSARDHDGSRNSGMGAGLASLRGRLGSAGSIISARVGRSSSASTWDGDEKDGEMEDGNSSSYRQRQPSDGELWGLRGGRGRKGS